MSKFRNIMYLFTVVWTVMIPIRSSETATSIIDALSRQEFEMFLLSNAARCNATQYAAIFETSYACTSRLAPPLFYNLWLQKSAAFHTNEMLSKDCLSTDDCCGDGSCRTLFPRIESHYEYSIHAENILSMTADSVTCMNEWFNSPFNCDNLFDTSFIETGVSYRNGLVAQNFGIGPGGNQISESSIDDIFIGAYLKDAFIAVSGNSSPMTVYIEGHGEFMMDSNRFFYKTMSIGTCTRFFFKQDGRTFPETGALSIHCPVFYDPNFYIVPSPPLVETSASLVPSAPSRIPTTTLAMTTDIPPSITKLPLVLNGNNVANTAIGDSSAINIPADDTFTKQSVAGPHITVVTGFSSVAVFLLLVVIAAINKKDIRVLGRSIVELLPKRDDETNSTDIFVSIEEGRSESSSLRRTSNPKDHVPPSARSSMDSFGTRCPMLSTTDQVIEKEVSAPTQLCLNSIMDDYRMDDTRERYKEDSVDDKEGGYRQRPTKMILKDDGFADDEEDLPFDVITESLKLEKHSHVVSSKINQNSVPTTKRSSSFPSMLIFNDMKRIVKDVKKMFYTTIDELTMYGEVRSMSGDSEVGSPTSETGFLSDFS